MNPVNLEEVLKDILTFKGFKESPIKDKLKWVFVLFPGVLAFIAWHLLLWIPALPLIIKDKFKKKRRH